MSRNIIRRRSIGGIAPHPTLGALIHPDIVDEHLSGEGEVREIDGLEAVRHAKVDDLDVSCVHHNVRVRGKEREGNQQASNAVAKSGKTYHSHRLFTDQPLPNLRDRVGSHSRRLHCPGLLAFRLPVDVSVGPVFGVPIVLEACESATGLVNVDSS